MEKPTRPIGQKCIIRQRGVVAQNGDLRELTFRHSDAKFLTFLTIISTRLFNSGGMIKLGVEFRGDLVSLVSIFETSFPGFSSARPYGATGRRENLWTRLPFLINFVASPNGEVRCVTRQKLAARESRRYLGRRGRALTDPYRHRLRVVPIFPQR